MDADDATHADGARAGSDQRRRGPTEGTDGAGDR